MNDMHAAPTRHEDAPASSFEFTGDWREFLPVALTNLLLTIVTLGIYRFWGKARERRYLWSRTRFIDDRLEWTGTGLEMFIGFLLVMAMLIPILLFLQFGVQALFLRGHFLIAGIAVLALYIGLFYLVGVALFRALRYRLSRSYWHGIRGGSDEAGWAYGWSALWKTAVAAFTGWLLTPWAMTSLWSERWNAMSFGPYSFSAFADTDGLMVRWLVIYAAGIAAVVLLAVGGYMAAVGAAGTGGAVPDPQVAITTLLTILGFYVVIIFASLAYYAAYYRKVIGSTQLAGLDFAFTARTRDWLILILGNVALVIITLGVGLIFLSYRNWAFAMRHLEASGEIDLTALTQSPTRAATDAEGLASAFDIGAI